MWYSLEPPRRGGSNEYPQSMFLGNIRKLVYTPVNSSFTKYIKFGFKGVKIIQVCYRDECNRLEVDALAELLLFKYA